MRKNHRAGGPTNARGRGERAGPAGPGDDVHRRAEVTVFAAAEARARGDDGRFERLIDELEVSPVGPDGRHVGSATVGGLLDQQVARLWPAGWQPRDAERYARRELGGPGAHVLVDTVAAEHAAHPGRPVDPRWAAQLEQLEATVWWDEGGTARLEQWAEKAGVTRHEALRLAVGVLSLFLRVPVLRVWMPYPGAPASVVDTWARAVVVPDSIDRKMLERVRALLAKAESTTFPEEAEALSTKAQQLMARHSIEAAFVRTQTGGPDTPGARRMAVEDPYPAARATLIHVVAVANRCRAVWNKELGFAEVLGFDVDLDIVELLATSLLVQATAAMIDAGRHVDRSGTSRTKSFRQSFLVAYANRIGERLKEAAEASVREATVEHGQALLPVLAGRERAVTALVDEAYSKLKKVGTSVTNEHGWHAGRAAADRADLGRNRERRLPER